MIKLSFRLFFSFLFLPLLLIAKYMCTTSLLHFQKKKEVLFTTSTFTFLNNTGSLSAGVRGQAVVCDQFEMEEQLKYNNFASEITCVLLIIFFNTLVYGLQYVSHYRWGLFRLDLTVFMHSYSVFLSWQVMEKIKVVHNKQASCMVLFLSFNIPHLHANQQVCVQELWTNMWRHLNMYIVDIHVVGFSCNDVIFTEKLSFQN